MSLPLSSQSAVFSPVSSPPTDQPAATAGEEEGSDLDFGNSPLRRSSPQVQTACVHVHVHVVSAVCEREW